MAAIKDSKVWRSGSTKSEYNPTEQKVSYYVDKKTGTVKFSGKITVSKGHSDVMFEVPNSALPEILKKILDS